MNARYKSVENGKSKNLFVHTQMVQDWQLQVFNSCVRKFSKLGWFNRCSYGSSGIHGGLEKLTP